MSYEFVTNPWDHTHIHTYIQTDRERERERERATDAQTDRRKQKSMHRFDCGRHTQSPYVRSFVLPRNGDRYTHCRAALLAIRYSLSLSLSLSIPEMLIVLCQQRMLEMRKGERGGEGTGVHFQKCLRRKPLNTIPVYYKRYLRLWLIARAKIYNLSTNFRLSFLVLHTKGGHWQAGASPLNKM